MRFGRESTEYLEAVPPNYALGIMARSLLFVALNALGVSVSLAAQPAQIAGVTLRFGGSRSLGQVGFTLLNTSRVDVEFLGGVGSTPVLAYNSDKLVVKDGCVEPPSLPQSFAFPFKAGAALSFEYMDPSKVKAFGVFVRAPGSVCWRLVEVSRP